MKHIYVELIVPASVILPIGAGFFNKVYRDKNIGILFYYLIFVMIAEISALITVKRNINNLPLLHFYTIAEFLFILRYFYLILNNQPARGLIKTLMIAFPVMAILDFIFIQDIHRFNSYPRPIAALIIIGLCMFYFLKYSEAEIKRKWSIEPLNWITTGLLIYFCSSLFYFAFINVIYENMSLKVYFIFGDIHATLVMLMYLLFTAGFLKSKNEG